MSHTPEGWMFSNYLEDEAIDVFTDHLLTLKVNDYLTTLGRP